MKFDIVLKNVRAVCYASNLDQICDIGIKEKKIVEISKDLSCEFSNDVFDLDGKLCVPGIIDTHMHASTWLGGEFSHKMLACSGVTTALDMSGPNSGVVEILKSRGAGLNIATIEYIRPNHTVNSTNPNKEELESLINRAIVSGSIGIKLLGGHYPLSLEATARAIEIGNKHGVYMAFHAGSLQNGSNLNGAIEAIKLAKGKRIHLAHINAYCRGSVEPFMQETEILLGMLEQNRNIISESYLSPYNGTSGEIVDGKPASFVTRSCLQGGNYEASEYGLKQAILDGYASVNLPYGGENILKNGEEALQYWLAKKSNVTVSFAVNPALARIYIASAKRKDGSFVVDAISSDGGGIVRNVIIPMGLNLVEIGALTLKEFVCKTSYNPALMLNLHSKGSLAVGNDADITIIDLKQRRAYMTIIGGAVNMYKGHIFADSGSMFCFADGQKSLSDRGIKSFKIDRFA